MFDPFLLLGLPRRFDLEPAEIDAAYLARALESHPDAFGGVAPGLAGDDAQAMLNEAKDVLANPERRANTLLELLGGPTKEQNKSLPPAFLAEMMDMREEMESATATNDPSAIAAWRVRGEAERAKWMADAAARFRAVAASAVPSSSELAAIRTALNAWRYIERMIEQLDHPGEALP